jgi:ABC-2 type transport system ATP-binding protein
MDALRIPLNRKIKALSGGQQAQVSLTMALAKRAPLLALDEPVASLDPIARLEFMRDVMAASAEGGPTIIIASHVISELERMCDWLLVLTAGRLQLAGPVDDLLAAHTLLTVPRQTSDAELPGVTVSRVDSDRHSSVLVATSPAWAAETQRPGWQAEPVGFEQLVLAYLQRPPLAVPRQDHALAGGHGAAGKAISS